MSDSPIERRRELPTPVGIALVICDSVYADPGGKRALVGLFDAISARNFPVVHPQLCVFGSLTEVMHGTECRVDIVHSETESVVAVAASLSPPGNPIKVWEFTHTFKAVRFDEPGTYFVRVFGNGAIVLQRPFRVARIKGKND
jgi:hypothetical protein